MKFFKQGDGEDEEQPEQVPRSIRVARWIAAFFVLAVILGSIFGGPCSKPDSSPEAAACTPDTPSPDGKPHGLFAWVIGDATVDGPDGIWDWTKWFQSPNGIPNGIIFGLAIFWAAMSYQWYVGYKRYYARKVVTPEGAWAADLSKHLHVLPGRRFGILRLGGVEGDPFIKANEGAILMPLGATRMHGRNLLVYARHVPKEIDTLPELASYMMAKLGIEGPYLESVAPEDIEPVDGEDVKRVMAEMRSNLKDNTAHHQLETVARGSRTALDHAYATKNLGFLPGSKEKSKTIIVSGNGASKLEDGT